MGMPGEDASAADVTAIADGTYEGSAKGIGGDVPVTVTVEGCKITAVEVGENSETSAPRPSSSCLPPSSRPTAPTVWPPSPAQPSPPRPSSRQ